MFIFFASAYVLYARASKDQEEATDPPLLELQTVVNDHVGAESHMISCCMVENNYPVSMYHISLSILLFLDI